MKKAFSLKKKLPKVLAVALAAACFAGAVPANAAGVTRAYSTIGSYGSFEEYMWYLCDNVKGDKVTFTTVDGVTGTPVVTKGANEAAADWASLATRNMMFAAGGKYQVSFAIKSTDASGWFKLSGKKFSEDLATHGDIVYNSVSVDGAAAAEAYVGNEWKNVVAEFTVDGIKPVNQFRIYLRGNAGTQLTIKDFDVKAIEEKATPDSMVPTNESTLEGWEEYGNDTTPDYCNIELSDTQADDIGSVHFKKDFTQSAGTSLGISQMIKGASVEEGKTYTLELNVKGTFAGPHDKFYIGFPWTFATWADATGDNFAITSDYVDWTNLKYDFTVTRKADTPIKLWAGGYVSVDCYIDNIKVYAKDDNTKTNILNNGNFYKTNYTVKNWDSIGSSNPNTEYCKLDISDECADDAGSLHFKKDFTQSAGTSLGISQMIKGASVEEGKTYTLELNVKGTFAGPHDKFYIGFPWTFATWADATGDNFAITSDYVDWTNLKYDFTVTRKADTPIKLWAGGYVSVDCYIDNIKVYAKDDASRTNLIANGDFCEKEAVVSDSSAVDNSPYIVQNVPGFDIGMLGVEGDRDISVVPGGSYDGSTAVEIRSGDKKERYFQQLEADAVKFVLGDTAVKATGHFKVTAGGTEPKIWLGFGKSYGGANSVGLHFANYLKNGKPDSGESFSVHDDGWYYFEKTVDKSTFKNKINNMTELVWVNYMCGIDARDKTGAAKFDNVTCEIISSAAPGDANNDGEINILDMVRMKKYSAGNESFENITRGMWLTENTDGAAALAALKKVIIGASSEYGK